MVDFFEIFCYTNIRRGRDLSGNAFTGDLLLNDPVFSYALQRDCDMEARYLFYRVFPLLASLHNQSNENWDWLLTFSEFSGILLIEELLLIALPTGRDTPVDDWWAVLFSMLFLVISYM